MAKVKSTATQAGRKLAFYFNRTARANASDQLKKASWLLAAGAGALGFTKDSVVYAVLVVIGWIVCQALATFILSIEDKKKARVPAGKVRTYQSERCALCKPPAS